MAIAVIALVGALLFGKAHDDLYAGLIGVQSIIVGFAFNVLFFLSSNHVERKAQSDAFEDEIQDEKLGQLAREIFFNVSYFNLISIFSICSSCLVLLHNAYSPIFTVSTAYWPWKGQVDGLAIAHALSEILVRTLVWIAFALVIESILTFSRIVRRVTFLFQERLSKKR